MLDETAYLFLRLYVFGGLSTICPAYVLLLTHVMTLLAFQEVCKYNTLPKYFQVSDQYFRYLACENL